MKQFKYYTIPPPDALKKYVRAYWVFEGSNLGGLPYVYRSMADACAEMVFHYKGKWQGIDRNDVVISGTDAITTVQSPSDSYRRFITCEDFAIFGAYLYPYAIHDLFRLSALELRGEMPSVDIALGPEGRQLEENILFASDNMERAKHLSTFLLNKVVSAKMIAPDIESCIRYMIHTRDEFRISRTAEHFCVTQRQLERKFNALTGFSPKSFARISRFQHALRKYGQEYNSLTDIAYECGYYDQSHFIHDFRKFSGYEPRAYFQGKTEGIEYRES
jgi:AraC-like DNA-binding protein